MASFHKNHERKNKDRKLNLGPKARIKLSRLSMRCYKCMQIMTFAVQDRVTRIENFNIMEVICHLVDLKGLKYCR